MCIKIDVTRRAAFGHKRTLGLENQMRLTRIIVAAALLASAQSVFSAADDGNKLPLPPISGWSSLQWGMTKDQVKKATGSSLTPREVAGLFYIGNISFYGYDANADIRYDDKKGLYEVWFIVWNVDKANAFEVMKLLHGKLEADLGVPSVDSIDKVNSTEFKTLWCTSEWSVFLDSMPQFRVHESGPSPAISVTYHNGNDCK